MMNEISVLYVDDEPINLMLFEETFDAKYKVLTAESAYKAFEILQKKPDIKVIISDIKMPGMDGLEFIHKVKALYPTKLVFILTGYDKSSEIKKTLENGLVTKYFQKPFKLSDIDNSIIENTNNSF